MAQILDFIKKNYFFILVIAVVVLSVLLFNTCSTLKTERADRKYQEKQDAQNYSAKLDSVTVIYDKKLKAYVSSKDEYVVKELSDLKKYNLELAAEIKKIKGDVIDAINSKAQIDIGKISTSSKVVVLDEKTNHYGLNFTSGYKDPGFTQTIEGTSRFFVIPDLTAKKWSIKADSTIFNTDLTTISVTYGSRLNKDKKYEVFAISPSPKVKFIDLTGAYIIENQPKPAPLKTKRFGIGPYIGYGLNNFNSPKFGMSIGVAAHYDLLQFKF
jgi:hypothetical protein